MSGFALRLSILGASLAALALVWHWLRPSRTHVLCALPAAAVGAFADWWVEALLIDSHGSAWLASC